MASSLFNAFGGGQQGFGPFANMAQFFDKFNAFRRMQGGQNPQAVVNEMLRNGQMSQEQFNQLANMANKIRPMMK